jgi:hypothetical protein
LGGGIIGRAARVDQGHEGQSMGKSHCTQEVSSHDDPMVRADQFLHGGADLLYADQVLKQRALAVATFALIGLPAVARAGDPKEEKYDQAAIAASLEEAPGTSKKAQKAGEALEVPPPPPRKRGLVIESGLGMMGFLGKLKNISPTASLFHLQVGFEPFKWFMVFGEGDLGFTSTRYTSSPRGYAIYGLGGGGRITVALSDRVSIYGQVDFGMMEASSDVLVTYGFADADTLNGYFGGGGGLEWYQPDPHLALALNGGLRKTQGFQRSIPGDAALSWLGSVALRYTF